MLISHHVELICMKIQRYRLNIIQHETWDMFHVSLCSSRPRKEDVSFIILCLLTLCLITTHITSRACSHLLHCQLYHTIQTRSWRTLVWSPECARVLAFLVFLTSLPLVEFSMSETCASQETFIESKPRMKTLVGISKQSIAISEDRSLAHE